MKQRPESVLQRFRLMNQNNLSDEDVRVFGEIRADLEQRGTPIGAYDLLIAAQAKSRDLVLVTNNMREFASFPRSAWVTQSPDALRRHHLKRHNNL